MVVLCLTCLNDELLFFLHVVVNGGVWMVDVSWRGLVMLRHVWCLVSEPSNVISILISSEFLKMDALVSVYTSVSVFILGSALEASITNREPADPPNSERAKKTC